MAPKTPIVFASLFEKQTGNDGRMYCVDMENGRMGWKPSQDSQMNTSIVSNNRKICTEYDTCQRNNIEYIAENRGGCLQWVPNDYKSNIKNTSVSFAVLPTRR